jgi:hypothetical protein
MFRPDRGREGSGLQHDNPFASFVMPAASRYGKFSGIYIGYHYSWFLRLRLTLSLSGLKKGPVMDTETYKIVDTLS